MGWFGRGQQQPQPQPQFVQQVQQAVLAPDDPSIIITDCLRAEGLIQSVANLLPMQGFVHALVVVDDVKEALRLGVDNLTARISLSAIVRDYLPTSVQNYVRAKQSGHDDVASFEEQMSSLSEAVGQVLEGVRMNNVSAFEVQEVFLRNKFAQGVEL